MSWTPRIKKKKMYYAGQVRDIEKYQYHEKVFFSIYLENRQNKYIIVVII